MVLSIEFSPFFMGALAWFENHGHNRRPVPDPNVVKWIDSLPSDAFFLSVLSLGEIRKGVEKLATGHRGLLI
jgi:predicted nucleic acid-binding protein